MQRHPFDPLSFAGGAALVAVGLLGALGGFDNIDTLRVGWPILLVLVGVVLVGSAVGNTVRDRPATAGAPDLDPSDLGPDLSSGLDGPDLDDGGSWSADEPA